MSKVLKWVLISLGILLGLALIGGVLLWLTLTGTFIRWGDSPVLMRELKSAYNENFVIYDYFGHSEGLGATHGFTYKLQSKSNPDIRFIVDFEDRSFDLNEAGYYPLAYANNKISEALSPYLSNVGFVQNIAVSDYAGSFDLSDTSYKDTPVDFVNNLATIESDFPCDYSSLLYYDSGFNRGAAVQELLNGISDIGLTNFSIDIAFVSADDLSVFEKEYKEKGFTGVYHPVTYSYMDNGDVYRVYMENGEILIKELDSGNYPLKAEHFVTLYLNS